LTESSRVAFGDFVTDAGTAKDTVHEVAMLEQLRLAGAMPTPRGGCDAQDSASRSTNSVSAFVSRPGGAAARGRLPVARSGSRYSESWTL
jgi:hypothetical protein